MCSSNCILMGDVAWSFISHSGLSAFHITVV